MILFFFMSISAWALTSDQLVRLEKMPEIHESRPQEVVNTIAWLDSLAQKNPRDSDLFAQEARLYFFLAVDDDNKDQRIRKYQKAIDAADQALAINPRHIMANFWKAAAIGKQGLDVGIGRSLKNAHPMKDCLDIVRDQDEKYEKGAAYRALGRLYFKLPGWPLSFGDNKKSLEYLKRAVEIDPSHIGNRAFYADVLMKTGNREEAQKQLDAIARLKIPENHKKEMKEYLDLAAELRQKLSR